MTAAPNPPAAKFLGEWDIETTHPARTGHPVCATCNEAVDRAITFAVNRGQDACTYNLNTHIAKVRRVVR